MPEHIHARNPLFPATNKRTRYYTYLVFLRVLYRKKVSEEPEVGRLLWILHVGAHKCLKPTFFRYQ